MMTHVQVKIKKLKKAGVIPSYAKSGDAGLDLTATDVKSCEGYVEYGTGLAVEIPEGFAGFLLPRSSLSNYDLVLSNHVGLIDSGYRGEIKARFKRFGSRIYMPGDRIVQLVVLPYPKVEFEEVNKLSETERGAGGYGSSGK